MFITYMDKITNINIVSGDLRFPYIVKYIPGGLDDYNEITYVMTDGNIEFESELTRTINTWVHQEKFKDFDIQRVNSKISTIRLYFPTYSVDTHSTNILYALDLCIYLGTHKITLGSFLIDRINALAAPRPEKYQNYDYYECVDLKIVDPYDLIYNDNMSDFRSFVKNEDINNDCTLLQCHLHVVEKHDQLYRKSTYYDGGQNVMDLSISADNYLLHNIQWHDDKTGVYLSSNILFNSVYNNNIVEYLIETYKLQNESIKIKYLLSIDGGLTVSWYEYDPETHEITHKYLKSDIKSIDKEWFKSWNNWKEGFNFVSTAIISELINDEWVDKIILKSNKIPITQDIFSKLLIDDNENINVNEIFGDMSINVTNIIQQSVVSYDIPNNSKSNIITPVFYRVRDLGNIVIHPVVIENICINLDAYKSKVTSFILQVEGMKFNEIGTTNSGTIFKVIGPSLPTLATSGNYYILSQDGEMITSGKYKYEM